jgi:hypothetical protein
MGDMAQTDSLIMDGDIHTRKIFRQTIDNKGLIIRVRKSPDLWFRNADCLAIKRSLAAGFRTGVERCELRLTVGGKYGPK